MKIAICDDDALCRQQVLSIVNEYIAASSLDIHVSVYENGTELIDDVLRSGGFDIYILDIIMPGVNGITLGTELRQADSGGKILYLTSSREYALDSYKVRAFDYLLKPVDRDQLLSVLEEVTSAVASRKEKSIIVKTRENTVKLALDNILYVELYNKVITYHLSDGKSIEGLSIRTSFAEAIHDILADSRFSLCGSSVAVNLYYITMVDNDTLSFKNGKKLYIGKRASREIRSLWSDFWMNMEENQ